MSDSLMVRLNHLLRDLDQAASQVVMRARQLETGDEFLGDADEFVRRVHRAREIEEQAISLIQAPAAQREAAAIADFYRLNGRALPKTIQWALTPRVVWNKELYLAAGKRKLWQG